MGKNYPLYVYLLLKNYPLYAVTNPGVSKPPWNVDYAITANRYAFF